MIIIFNERVFPCSPVCVGTHYIDPADLELRTVCILSAGIKSAPPPSAPKFLGVPDLKADCPNSSKGLGGQSGQRWDFYKIEAILDCIVNSRSAWTIR